MIASEPAEQQEVHDTEPAAAEENQTHDYWSEDFDKTDAPADAPVEEVETTEPSEEPADERPEYITKGLGSLDRPVVLKRKGKLYDISDLDQLRDLAERGLDATSKLQEVAELKKELLKAQNPDVSEQELQNINVETEVETIAQSIVNSPIAEDFKSVITELPEEVVNTLRSDPQMLKGLKLDVESGLAQKVMPSVRRYMDIEGLDFRSAYLKAGSEVVESAKRRDTAVTQLTSAPTKTGNVEVKEKDIWDIDDNEFRALMASERR